MEPEEVQSPARWYQRAAVAVLVGIALAVGTIVLVVAYAMQSYGQAGAFVMLVLAPIMPGFVVGLMVGREGDKWSAIAAGLFAIGMAAYMASAGGSEDHLTVFMMALGLGVPAVALAALFGKIGETVAALAPKVRSAIAILSIVALGGVPAGYWLDVQWELFHFKHSVLPAIESRFSDHVVRIPSDSKWTIDHASFPVGKHHIISASTQVRGHRLQISSSPSGRVYRCRWAYEPPRSVKIVGQKAIKAYLKEMGAPDEIVGHLRYYDDGGVLARSWFCMNALSPTPRIGPCTQKPACGSDYSFALLRDGTIRVGFWYYRG